MKVAIEEVPATSQQMVGSENLASLPVDTPQSAGTVGEGPCRGYPRGDSSGGLRDGAPRRIHPGS